jgi:hypothetical protein
MNTVKGPDGPRRVGVVMRTAPALAPQRLRNRELALPKDEALLDELANGKIRETSRTHTGSIDEGHPVRLLKAEEEGGLPGISDDLDGSWRGPSPSPPPLHDLAPAGAFGPMP